MTTYPVYTMMCLSAILFHIFIHIVEIFTITVATHILSQHYKCLVVLY